jgi:ribonucleoside-diphosphate reductase beta chain
LTSFLWEEAKHVEGFRRFFDEVVQEHGDLTRFGNAAYNKIFYEELPNAMNRLRTDTSIEAQVRASTTYNMIIEGVMAETGYYAFHKVLTRNNLMPGMQQFVANLKRDESRHIAFAIYFLSRLVAEHGDKAWNALEARMHELLPLVIESNNLDRLVYTNGIPFDLDVNEFNEYSTNQFQKRIERIQKSRNQSLEEINTIANSLDEVLA